jgi:hypothetical protein
MNLAFLLVAVQEYMDRSLMIVADVCTGVAVLTHYLVLTSLMWMLVEAINMYQLLITVFATSETKFMCKRMLCAWGMYLTLVLYVALGITCRLVFKTEHSDVETGSVPTLRSKGGKAPTHLGLLEITTFIYWTLSPEDRNIQFMILCVLCKV